MLNAYFQKVRLMKKLSLSVITAVAATFFSFQNLEAKELRIVSYNTRHAEQHDGTVSLSAVADVILRENADIVLLQEVDNKAGRTGNKDQAAEIAKLTGMSNYHFTSFMPFDGGLYGLAILTNLPNVQFSDLKLPDAVSGGEPRSSTSMEFQVNGKKIIINNVHFYKNFEERKAQLNTVIEAQNTSDDIAIVMGDFNINSSDSGINKATATSTTIDHGKDSKLIELLLAAGYQHIEKQGDKVTYPSDMALWGDDGEGNVELDHVFIKGGASFVTLHKAIPGISSDHKPILMILDIPE